MPDVYSYVNKKGLTYYLNSLRVTLKNGFKNVIYYFTRNVRATAINELPEGFIVVESKRTALPLLKRA